MSKENESKNEFTNSQLAEVKERLKTGKLTEKDLKVLQNLVEHTEMAAKMLRAAIVE